MVGIRFEIESSTFEIDHVRTLITMVCYIAKWFDYITSEKMSKRGSVSEKNKLICSVI